MIEKLASILGWAVSIFMGLSASMFAWLVPLFDIAPAHYLLACALVALVLAMKISRE